MAKLTGSTSLATGSRTSWDEGSESLTKRFVPHACQAQLQPGAWPHLRQLPTHRYHSVDGSHWNEAGNVMKWSGDKTLGSFSVYLEDDSRAAYYLHKRWKTLTAQEGARSIESAEGRAAKPLQNKQLAV